jgi:carbon starvation protein
MFPLLFVTVACGACSGFHALVSSGTTSKQLDSENDIRPVGYGCMLLEGVVALMALVAVASLSQKDLMTQLSTTEPVKIFASNLAGFCQTLGIGKEGATSFIMLSVAAFLMTSIDACARLARFTWQELWVGSSAAATPGEAGEKRSPVALFMGNKYVATFAVVSVSIYLLAGNPQMSKDLWTMFASANQMLAALTLLTASLWLFKMSRNFWIALLPMLFMTVTSGAAVLGLFKGNLDKWLKNGFASGGVTTIASALLFILAVVLLILGAVNLRRLVKERAARK